MRFDEVLEVCLDFSLPRDGVLCRRWGGVGEEGLRIFFRPTRTDLVVERREDVWDVSVTRGGAGVCVRTAEELQGALGALCESGPRRWL